VEWRIATDRADQRLRGAEGLAPLDDAERDGVRYLLRADGDRPGQQEPAAGETHLLVAVPTDIQSIKARDRGLAIEWRLALRSALEPAFELGYAAVEMLYSSDGARAAYVLVTQPAHPSGGDDQVRS
jgi:predicted GNAT superfamily acetyltransferase